MCCLYQYNNSESPNQYDNRTKNATKTTIHKLTPDTSLTRLRKRLGQFDLRQ